MGYELSDDDYHDDHITEAQQQQIYQIFNDLEKVIQSKDLKQFVDFYKKNNKRPELVEYLFMDYESENEESILTMVASYGTVEMFNYLLHKNHLITSATTKYFTAFDCAIIYNKNDMLEYIAEQLCTRALEISIIHSDLSVEQASIIAHFLSNPKNTINSLLLNNDLINDDSIAILFNSIKSTNISINFDNNEKIKNHPMIAAINEHNNSLNQDPDFQVAKASSLADSAQGESIESSADSLEQKNDETPSKTSNNTTKPGNFYLNDDNDPEIQAAIALSLADGNQGERVESRADSFLSEQTKTTQLPLKPAEDCSAKLFGSITAETSLSAQNTLTDDDLAEPIRLSSTTVSSASSLVSVTPLSQSQQKAKEIVPMHPLAAAYATFDKNSIEQIVREDIKQWEQLVVSCFYTSSGDKSYAFKLFVDFEEELPPETLCTQYGVTIKQIQDIDDIASQYVLTASAPDAEQAKMIVQFLIEVQILKGYASSEGGPDGLLHFIDEGPSLRSLGV